MNGSEEAITKTRAELAEQESLYRLLFNMVPIGLGLADLEGNLVAYNDSMLEPGGYTREDIARIGNVALLYYDPVDRADALALAQRQGYLDRHEVRFKRKDGSPYYALLSLRPLQIGDRRFWQAMVEDITARKQAEEGLRQAQHELEKRVQERTGELQRANAALQAEISEHQRVEAALLESEKLAAAGRMAARVAHEINDPLAAIKVSFRLIGRAVPEEHRHHHYIAKIETEIDRIARIVHQMLELSLPASPATQECDCAHALQEVVALMRLIAEQQHVKIHLDADRASVRLPLPEGHIRQILYNLLQNAIEASLPAGTVQVIAAYQSGRLTITVSDQGHGIPEEIRPHLFGPYFSSKNQLAASGRGLGLSVCKSLVESMGGTIDFESSPGLGTEFRLVIPVEK